jgi:hypothetical protein
MKIKCFKIHKNSLECLFFTTCHPWSSFDKLRMNGYFFSLPWREGVRGRGKYDMFHPHLNPIPFPISQRE